jgi:hypothetical protein
MAIDEIRIFNIDSIYYGVVFFSKKSDCENVYSFFNHPQKLANCPTKNSNDELITFSYCYDLTDLKDSKWYAVVLRNLDTYCEVEKIITFCQSFIGESSVFYALEPQSLYDSTCSIVIVDDLDSAEKLCSAINLKEFKGIFSGKIIKVKNSFF